VAENTQVKQLFHDALTGKLNRRQVMQRGAALGLSATVVGGLAQESMRAALAAEEGTLNLTYYNWILDLHSPLTLVNDDFGKTYPLNAEVAPTENFGFDRQPDLNLRHVHRSHAVPRDDRDGELGHDRTVGSLSS
jgi:hypothetical protein